MSFTDLFIRRPVLASVVSLFIVLLGANAFDQLSVREYPKVEEAAISIRTVYTGASPDLVQGFITTPIQQSIASAEGISYITSSSTSGVSNIVANIRLGYSSDTAITEIMAKVGEVRGELPEESDDPVTTKGTRNRALMYLQFRHPDMTTAQVTDFLQRVARPQFATLEGVGEVAIIGDRIFAMRIWLDPVRMAAFDVTATEAAGAIRANNYLSSAGETNSDLIVMQVKANTDLTDVAEFENIVIRTDGDTLVRVKDIARVELSAENFDSVAFTKGKETVYLSVSSTPSANPLEVSKRVRDELAEVNSQAPEGLVGEVGFDATNFISASLEEVVTTLTEAALIVILVVFVFLGQLRSVVIPVVAIPLSLIGSLFLLWSLGYSINLLTLLALVLAIGLVVDDAIVVVENIHRHIEEGMKPLDAALTGAREIAMPVISMTLTLAAVYAPLGFLTGVIGTLFKEFAFTLAGAVIISGIIALTLSPMMCSKLMVHTTETGLAHRIDVVFTRLMDIYRRQLRDFIQYRVVTVVFALLILAAIPFLLMFAKSELAPSEDQGILFVASAAPDYANLDYVARYTRTYHDIYSTFPEYRTMFQLSYGSDAGESFGGMLLSSWDKRDRTAMEILPELQQKMNAVSGLRVFVIAFPSLPGSGGGAPVQFIVQSISDYRLLATLTDELVDEARRSGLFTFIASDLEFSKPEVRVTIDRDKVARLGVTMEDIGTTLSTLLGERRINRFSRDGRSYKVIPQAAPETRIDADWINRYYVRTASGEQVPLSTVIDIETVVQPAALNQFQQLNSAKLEGALAPGVSLGDALAFLENKAAELLPEGFSVDYDGVSRQYIEEGGRLYGVFFVSLLAIYLVLAAQFESFRDPFIILISVPLSICGALIPLTLGFATLNIYSQIGLITLIGLITKHGILIVEFANKLQLDGLSKHEAVVEAAAVRLRPVLMTTAAMVLGVLPLIFASGAGAVSRFNIGVVIASGMVVGTLFTLFVVPVVYSFVARVHESSEGDAAPIDGLPHGSH
ncbi:MAG: MMPL family transporter [Gammaproteobacteria bacterium]|nr:MMPL family transporter [Gammaproteobacteria bacterium]